MMFRAVVVGAALLGFGGGAHSFTWTTSSDLQKSCAAPEGSVGRSFCDVYLQAQIEARWSAETGGPARACVSRMDDGQIAALRSRLIAWLSPPGRSNFGMPATAMGDISTALNSANVCP